MARSSITGGFIQKPDPPFGFIDPVLRTARGGDITAIIARAMSLSHESNDPQIVVAQLGQHVLGAT
jgi:hypothetical protein